MPLRLPPLSSLRFFEVAGRHQSFKRAAEELNVTPGAISHGINALEKALGVTLFVREPRKLTLTPAGADYLTYVSEAFSLIAIGTGRLPSHHADRAIAISCAPTVASRWLLPILSRFRSQWPAVTVSVDTSLRQVGFPVDGFDFAIRLSRTPAAGEAWVRLFGVALAPVCAPSYPEGRLDANGRVDLHNATLIHVTSVSEDWGKWAEEAGITGLDLTRGLRVDTLQLALEAAAAGQGVALGRKPLVDTELADGSVILARPEIVTIDSAYWLVGTPESDHRPDLRAFKRWLIDEAQGLDALLRNNR